MKRGKFESAAPAPKQDQGWKNPILHTYLTSLLSLVLCCTMFLGTTMAWFTDDVTNTGNQIYVGTLAVDALHKEGEGWISLSENPTHTVFSNDVTWFPGQFASETVKVVNTGGLPLKYRVELLLNTENSAIPGHSENPVTMEDLKEIAQYLTVNVAEGEVSAEDAASWTPVKEGGETAATLKNIVEKGIPIFVSSKNLEAPVQTQAEGETADNSASENIFSIGIRMSESTPSKYMGWTLAFNIKFVAYQAVEEAVIPWNGTVDTAWFNMTTPAEIYEISEASQLAGLAALVNNGNSFENITVKLTQDIDLNGMKWTPIGVATKTFNGTFDGAGHTISNLYVENGAYYTSTEGVTTDGRGYGFFGEVSGATIQNLTFAYASVNMDDDIGNTAGIVAGIANSVTLEDVHVKYSAVGGSKHIGGLLGDAKGAVTVTNCSVSNTTIQGTYNCAALIGFAEQAVSGGGNTTSAITWTRGGGNYVNLTAAAADGETAPVSGLYYVNSVGEQPEYYTAWSDTYSYPMADVVNMESGETVKELPNGAFTPVA